MMSGRLAVGAIGAGAATATAASPMRLVGIALVAVLVGLALLVIRQRKTVVSAGKPAVHHSGSRDVAVLGLSPTEVMVGAVVIGIAVISGLALGGLFSR